MDTDEENTLSTLDCDTPVPSDRKIRVIRFRSLRRSFWAIVLLPAIAMIGYQFSAQLVYLPVFRAINFASFVAYGALLGVMMTQVFAWWLWKRCIDRRWIIGWALWATMAASRFVVEWSQGGFYSMSFLHQAATSFIFFAVSASMHGLLIAAVASFIQFRFHDLYGHDLYGQTDQSETLSRTPWSIRGMFATTLVAALAIAGIRWCATVFPQFSDAGYFAWALSSAAANVACLLAAALRGSGGSRWFAYWIILASIAVSIAGMNLWVMLTPNGFSWINAEQLARIAADPICMYAIHLWIFKRWRNAGYELRRSGRKGSVAR